MFVECYNKYKPEIDMQLYYIAARKGHLEFLKLLMEYYESHLGMDMVELWVNAFRGNHIHILDYLKNIYGNPPNVNKIIMFKGPDTLEKFLWLEENSDFEPLDTNLIPNYVFASLSILEWIIKKAINKQDFNFLKELAKHLDHSIFPRPIKKLYDIADPITYCAISNNDVKTLQILEKYGYPLNENIIYSFGKEEDNIDILRWVFFRYGTLYKHNKVAVHVLNGNFEGVIKCFEEGIVFDEKLVVWAIKSGHMKIAQWLTVNHLIPKYIN